MKRGKIKALILSTLLCTTLLTFSNIICNPMEVSAAENTLPVIIDNNVETEPVVVTSSGNWTKDRIWGNDRFETANLIADRFCQTNAQLGLDKVSQYGLTFKDAAESPVDTVILADGFNYPDALCASPLSKVLNAPILLTHSGNLTPSTANQIKKMKIKHVMIVGGEGAVSNTVVNQLHDLGISDVARLGGIDRYETCLKIAEKVYELEDTVDNYRCIEGNYVYMVPGNTWQDALAVSPAAAIETRPIILVPVNNEVNPTAQKQIKALLDSKGVDMHSNFLMGTEEECKPEVVKNMITSSFGESDYRAKVAVTGNKYVDSFDINRVLFDDVVYCQPDNIFMSRGDVFADSLTVAPLAGKMSSPIFYSAPCEKNTIAEEIQDSVDRCDDGYIDYDKTVEFMNNVVNKATYGCNKVTYVGGQAVVDDNSDRILKGDWSH